MENKINTWLFHILNSINEIDSFYEDNPKSIMEYQKEIKQKERWKRI